MVRNLSTVTLAPARTVEPTSSSKKIAVVETALVRQASGNTVPKAGEELPSATVETIDIARAVERLSQLARQTARDLHFRVDDASGRLVITVINSETNEVVRQIPTEEMLQIAHSMSVLGTIIDAET